MLVFVAILLTSPLWLPARIAIALSENGRLFRTCSQIVSVFPGRLGIFLRRGFYHMTLEQSPTDVFIELATWFSHPRVKIGKQVYIGGRCTIGKCDIGDDVFIGSNVDILSGRYQHFSKDPSIPWNQGGSRTKIHIGNRIWIGNSSVVMADVGDNSIIGAGSVVVKPIPPNSVAVGNPAVVKKQVVDVLQTPGSDGE
jgi:acetyltransferase-like isoleucine patch superfamily enzyme